MIPQLIDTLLGSALWLGLLAAKATMLLALALLVERRLRSHSARVHHTLWTVTFAALALLPVLELALPAIPLPGLSVPTQFSALVEPGQEALPPTVPEGEEILILGDFAISPERKIETAALPRLRADEEPVAQAAMSGNTVRAVLRAGVASLVALWAAGAAAMLVLLAVAMWRARRLVARAPIVRQYAWRQSCTDVCAELGIRRGVSLRVSDRVDAPMAGGVLAPFVLLPEAALQWSRERREVVLRHELMHLRRFDPLRALAGRIAAAFYWFHPLVWLAGQRALLAREAACDEAVVELGTRPSLYATVLLELAESAGRAPIPAVVIPMIQRSLLETRLMSILTEKRPASGRRAATLLVAVMSMAALSVAVAAPQEEAPPPPPPVADPEPVVEPVPVVAAEPAEAPQPQEEPVPAAAEVATTAPAPVTAAAPAASPQSAAMPAVAPHVAATVPAPGLPAAAPLPAAGVRAEAMSPAPVVGSTTVGSAQVAPRPATGSVWSLRTTASAPAASPAGTWTVPAPQDEPAACAWESGVNGSFNGSLSVGHDGETVVHEAVGTINGGRMIKQSHDGVTMCLRARGDVEFSEDMTRVTRIAPGSELHLATVEDGRTRTLVMTGLEPASQRWEVDGRERAFDAEAREWRDSLLQVLGRYWQIGTIRGEVSSLRGEISSLRGHMSSLKGERSALRGEASALRGEIAAVKGEQSALQGEISSVQGEVSAMQGEIEAYRSNVAALQARGREATGTELQEIEARILEYQRAIEQMTARLEEYDVDRKVEELERAIEELAVERRVEELRIEAEELAEGERAEALDEEIEAYQVESMRRIEQIQAKIVEIDADSRIEQLQAELRSSLERLRSALEAIQR